MHGWSDLLSSLNRFHGAKMAKEESLIFDKKRKFDETELEIDVDAPEPPSKKALRKARKQSVSKPNATKSQIEEPDLTRLNGLESERSEFGIWIGNLAFTVTKKDLYKWLITNSDYPFQPEQITRIHLPGSVDGKAQNKGFAYVDLVSQDLVEAALQLSESIFGGRRLLIKDAKNFQGRPESTKPKVEVPSKPPNRRIFVGNLDFATTKEDIEKHFGVCGPIARTQLATFEDSGKCKGYGWIEFESLSSAETAIRGWTEVKDTRKMKGTIEGDAMKKVWLHRLGYQKLRMEYAEDSTTRYNKRYGKNSKNTTEVGDKGGITEETSEAFIHRPRRPNSDDGRSSKKKDRPRQKSNSRYEKSTVQKLTGAMVEGQGSKVTFK